MPRYKLATPKAGDGISSGVRFVMKLFPILYEWHIRVKIMSEGEENWKKLDFVLPDKKEKKITGN